MPTTPSDTGVSAPAAAPTRYGTAMVRRFGWFYYALGLGRMLGRIRLEDHSVDHIRNASRRGPVVYVLLHRSSVDHLVLNTVLNRRRLPLSVWGHGTTSFFWQPVASAWRDVAYRVQRFFEAGFAPDPVDSGWVADRVRQGDATTAFLDEAKSRLQQIRGGGKPDLLQTLLDIQDQSDRPIQLVPVAVVWDRSPDVIGNPARDFFIGAREAAGSISALHKVYVRSPDAFVQAGESIDLEEFRGRVHGPRQSRVLHALLRRYLHRETRVVRGPQLLSGAVMKRMVLDNPPMRALAEQEANALGATTAQVTAQMSKEYDTIAARFSWRTVRSLSVVLRPLWTRVFSGVDAENEDLERIRIAMRQGSVILAPCHKSHLDYVLMSWVMLSNDLIVPHVVAGINLAIWPVSILLRGAGAFFIRRSFADRRIHPAIFSRYLRELIQQEYPVEFFIEGGRTRSGKLMRPKLGVLGMVLDAAELRHTGREVTILPIALAYEQVAEEGVYARELGGEDKKAEDMGQLFRSFSIIRRRFGRVYLRVGTPIALSEIVDPDADQQSWSDRSAADRRETLQRVGERIVHRIGEATVVLPTALVAMALLAHHRRGIKHQDLLQRIHRFRAFLQACDAPVSKTLQHHDQAITHALDRFVRAKRIEPLEHSGDRIWSVVPDERITLAFYKNQVLHYFAPVAMTVAAIRAGGDEGFTADSLAKHFSLLLWTLRREFILDPDRSATSLLAESLDKLVSYGALERQGENFHVVESEFMGELYGLLRSLLESYRLVLTEASQLSSQHYDARIWIKHLQGERDVFLANENISRPEALSLVSLQNAINSYVEESVLGRQDNLLQDRPEARIRRLQLLSPMVP
ncbi:MAG: hypothetical protein GWP91_01415 [Rhodobacterales bacterium]|nr:hypothetical protein [Rhodobacterales bacterium]